MIKEDYVSFETAKLLKEKGFDVPYDSFSGVYRNGKFLRRNPGGSYLWNMGDEIVDVCSLQMAMKWLREVHYEIINVYYEDNSWVAEHYRNEQKDYTLIGNYSSYEQACEAGIKYCLENLI